MSQEGCGFSCGIVLSRCPSQIKLPAQAKPERDGLFGLYWTMRKLRLLVSVPVGVVTTTGPVVAPVGTTAVM